MSHFTTIKTQFVSAEPLKKALAEVRAEFGFGEVRENATVSGYRGNTAKADIVVSTRNAGYDLGFRKQGETCELVADWYGIRDFKQADLTARLAQRYAYHTVKDKLDQQGFALVDEEVRQDKTIHLVLRRTVGKQKIKPMEIQEIEVVVQPDGKVTLHVRGAPGAQCLDLTADIEKALGGQVLTREHTPEFDQPQQEFITQSGNLQAGR